MKTTTVPIGIASWYLIDAKNQSVGHVAAKAAHILRGKHKPSFSPHQLGGDNVIVINAAEVSVHPAKLRKKAFVKHSGYLGNLKTIPLFRLLEKKPEEVIIRAVKGMLPKNKLRDPMMIKLKVFADDKHPHEAQQPIPVSLK